jgi:hypothetical protein
LYSFQVLFYSDFTTNDIAVLNSPIIFNTNGSFLGDYTVSTRVEYGAAYGYFETVGMLSNITDFTVGDHEFIFAFYVNDKTNLFKVSIPYTVIQS